MDSRTASEPGEQRVVTLSTPPLIFLIAANEALPSRVGKVGTDVRGQGQFPGKKRGAGGCTPRGRDTPQQRFGGWISLCSGGKNWLFPFRLPAAKEL